MAKKTRKKTIRSYKEEVEEAYGITTFSYDIFLDIFGDYPTDDDRWRVEEIFVLKIIAVEKDTTRHLNTMPFEGEYEEYQSLFRKYYRPDEKYTIVDILLSKVPIKTAIEEGTIGGEAGEMEVNSRDWYTIKTVDKYRINKRNLYDFYFRCVPSDFIDVHYSFYNFIFKKAISIQPSIFKPKFELGKLSVPLDVFLDDKNLFLKEWNTIRKQLGDGSDAFSQFLIDSFNSIKNKLKKDKYITECKNCGDLAKYNEKKKYCSPICRKQAENRRGYERHKNIRRATNREDMRDTRNFRKKLEEKEQKRQALP